MVFFATPHGVAMSQVERLLEAGVRVIDLAADFRLQDTDVFQKWYKMEHSCPDILSQSAYGLPELLRDKITQAKVIGNPGCYPPPSCWAWRPCWKAPRRWLIPASDCRLQIRCVRRW